MIRFDLDKAGIPYKDASGRVADFHALRHTFITNIVKGGASPKVAQGLARHSKITLTMDTYTHMSLLDQRAGLSGLPELPCLSNTKIEHGQVANHRTGTDDQPVVAYKPAYKKLAKTAYFTSQPLSTIVTDKAFNEAEGAPALRH